MKTNIFTLFAFIFISIGFNSPLVLQGSNRAGLTKNNEIVNPEDSLQLIEKQKEFRVLMDKH